MAYIRNYKKWNDLYEATNGKLDQGSLANIPAPPGDSQNHKLNPIAAAKYAEMVAAAKKEGIEWGITDSYRPYEVQNRIFDWDFYNATGRRRKKGTAGVPVAYPGTSNHGWGSAVDLKVKKGDAAYNWLLCNSKKFGFSNPFIKYKPEDTCETLKNQNPVEPWHWEHIDSAKAISGGATAAAGAAGAAAAIGGAKSAGLGNVHVEGGKIVTSHTGEKAKNINILLAEMQKQGLTNLNAQLGILAVIGKECGYIPQNEIMNYSKERLPEVFGKFSKTGSMVPKGQGAANYNELAVKYEKNPEKLASFIYCCKYGNGPEESGDGWKYRGRGFNGITFKAGYEEWSKETGLDLVGNPDQLNQPEVAAKVAVRYFMKNVKSKGIDPNGFKTVEDAIWNFSRANAGWGNSSTVLNWAYNHAIKQVGAFKVGPGGIA